MDTLQVGVKGRPISRRIFTEMAFEGPQSKVSKQVFHNCVFTTENCRTFITFESFFRLISLLLIMYVVQVIRERPETSVSIFTNRTNEGFGCRVASGVTVQLILSKIKPKFSKK
jgi:hypothetical protein